MHIRVMSELLGRAAVTSCIHYLVGCLEVLIHLDAFVDIELYSSVLKAHPLYIRLTADCKEYSFNFNCKFVALIVKNDLYGRKPLFTFRFTHLLEKLWLCT